MFTKHLLQNFVCGLLLSAAAFGVDNLIVLDVDANSTAGAINFSWERNDDNGPAVEISRRIQGQEGAATWTSLATVSRPTNAWTDTSVSSETVYEYRFLIPSSATFSDVTAVYASCGVNIPLVDNQGTVLLVVDDTLTSDLVSDLQRFEMDLAGDGWSVERLNFGRDGNASPEALRAAIQSKHAATPLSSIILFGRLPVVESGYIRPDEHARYQQATDLFYADINGNWEDSRSDTLPSGEVFSPNDGHYDHNSVPGPDHQIEIPVGRIDLSLMNAWTLSEAELLKRYLEKNHNFRHLSYTVPREVYASNLGFDRSPVETSAAIAMVGTENYTIGFNNPQIEQTSPFLFGFDFRDWNGANYAAYRFKSQFTLNFGSNKLSWKWENNTMRAMLAQPWYGLTCFWGALPNWYIHHLGMGKPIGYSHLRTVNNTNNGNSSSGIDYQPISELPLSEFPENLDGYVHLNLMGDPTLRIHPVAPAQGLSATPDATGVELSWQASNDPNVVGYHIYTSNNPTQSYARLTSSPVSSLSYRHSVAPSSDTYYMVRSVKLETTPTGSYWNAAQGIFQKVSPSAVNSAPIANNLSISTPPDSPINFAVSASDPDSDNVNLTVATNTSNGELSGVAPNFTYLPNPGFQGTDSFQFNAWDGTQESTGTVTIEVSPDAENPGAVNIPFTGTPFAIPGRIEAEDFDEGGQNIAYSDIDPTNAGGLYRESGVDIERSLDIENGYSIGWILNTEWIEYSVNVTPGTYDLSARVACPLPNPGAIRFLLNNRDLGTLAVPETLGWSDWTNAVLEDVLISESGPAVLRVEFINGPFNLNWLEFGTPNISPTAGIRGPWLGATRPIPGLIQAEDFDVGIQGQTYSDVDPTNQGNSYRNTGVDLEPSLDYDNTVALGWVEDSEWTEYTIEVTPGTYNITARIAAPFYFGSSIRFLLDGRELGTLFTGTTAGWDDWADNTLFQVPIYESGPAVLRVEFAAGFFNLNWINFDATDLTPPTPPNPPTDPNRTPYLGARVSIPGKIEAENFDIGEPGTVYSDRDSVNTGESYRETEVDIEPSLDTDNGFTLGWIEDSEWVEYSVDVTPGTYDIVARIATPFTNVGSMRFLLDGRDLGTLPAQRTGDWYDWDSITLSNVQITESGPAILRIEFSNSSFNLNWIEFKDPSEEPPPPPDNQSPFGGTAANLPGRIEAENFDEGGLGIAYLDSEEENFGLTYTNLNYRTTGVDIESSNDLNATPSLGWIDPGEWLEYTVNVTPGTYDFNARVASGFTFPGDLAVELDGRLLGVLPVNGTGDWQNWETLTIPQVAITESGTHILRLRFEGAAGFNLNWVEFDNGSVTPPPPTGQSPFGGTAHAVPGRVQAEDYDLGGEGIAYSDADPENFGGSYRADGVDIETSGDTGGGFNVGWFDDAQWMEYTLDTTPGIYQLDLRASSAESLVGDVRITLDGEVLGIIDVETTGDWGNWVTFSLPDIALSTSGEKVLRLEMIGDAVNVNWFEFVQTAPASNLIFTTISEVGQQAAAMVDSDGDGTTNLAEFAFGSHSGSTQSRPVLPLGIHHEGNCCQTVPVAVGGTLGRNTYRAAGLLYTFQGSDDLVDWDQGVTFIPNPSDVPSAPTGYRYLTFRLADPDEEHGFLRVMVEEDSSQ